MYKIILFTIIILLNNLAVAVDLQEALTNAYSTNDKLKLIRRHFLEAIEESPKALAHFMPKVYMDIEAIQRERKMNIPARHLVISQPIFSGGSGIAALKAAQSSFKAARSKYYQNEQEIILELIEIYLNCYEMKEKYQISEASVIKHQQQLKDAEEKFKLGEATKVDVAFARSNLALVEANRLKLYAYVQLRKAEFMQSFGIEFEDMIEPSVPENLFSSLDELVQQSITFNPMIENKRHDVHTHQANEMVAKAQLLPQVNFKMSINNMLNSNSSTESLTGKKRYVKSALSVRIPIYMEGGAEYSKIRQAKNKTRSAVIQLDAAIKQIKAEVIKYWELFEAEKSQIIALSQGVEAAQITYDGRVQEEAVGSKTILDVLIAAEKLYEVKVKKIEAYKTLILAAYKMKYMAGALTAKSLNLKVVHFIPEDEFNKIKTKLIGF